MTKNLLICAKHDSFWVSVSQELARLSNCNLSVWIGKEVDISLADKPYISYDPYDLFHLDGMTLSGGRTTVNSRNLDVLDYYNFAKILDRADVGSRLSFSERNHLFFSHCHFWTNLLLEKSIDAVVFSNVPHTPDSYGLFMCAKMLNISIISVNVTPFPGLVYLTDKTLENILPGAPTTEEVEANRKLLEEYKFIFGPNSNSELWYMRRQREREFAVGLTSIKNLLKKDFPSVLYSSFRRAFPNTNGKKYRSIKRHNGVYDGSKKSFLREMLVLLRWEHYRWRLERELKSREVSEIPEKFLYFPLHYQPEATTAPGAGFFSDQHVLVDLISSFLPNGIFLVVKEHPTQLYRKNWGISGRAPGYWSNITRNKNVILVDSSISSKELIGRSLAVVTGTGTAGYEAIMQGKRSIVFGSPWYLRHPKAIQTNFSNVANVVNSIIHLETEKLENSREMDDEVFINEMSKLLIRCDVHGYTRGVVERNPTRIASAISNYVS
jgi:hypothetical protein